MKHTLIQHLTVAAVIISSPGIAIQPELNALSIVSLLRTEKFWFTLLRLDNEYSHYRRRAMNTGALTTATKEEAEQLIQMARERYNAKIQFNPVERLIYALTAGKDELAAEIILKPYGKTAWEGYCKHHREKFESEIQTFINHPEWICKLGTPEFTVDNMIRSQLNLLNFWDGMGPKTLNALEHVGILTIDFSVKADVQKDEAAKPSSSFSRKYSK